MNFFSSKTLVAVIIIFFLVVPGRADSAKKPKPVFQIKFATLAPDGTPSSASRVPLKHPLASFFTATVRAGSQPSRTLDLLGERAGARHTISYARIRIQ